MSTKPNYYPDGYTRRARIRDSEDLGGIQFEYRPMLAEERDRLRESLNKGTAQRNAALLDAVIAKQIVSWDVTNPTTGAAMPVEASVVHRLPPPLQDALYLILTGLSGGDPLEDPTKEEADDYAASILGADIEGRDLGNSTAG